LYVNLVTWGTVSILPVPVFRNTWDRNRIGINESSLCASDSSVKTAFEYVAQTMEKLADNRIAPEALKNCGSQMPFFDTAATKLQKTRWERCELH
jgi:hypothetical protein